MKEIHDEKIYNSHDKYKMEVRIFNEIWKQSTLMYDKIEFNSLREKEMSRFYYEIDKISLTIGLSIRGDILYTIKMDKDAYTMKLVIPAVITTYSELELFLFSYFDELLYAVYLAAKDKNYKIKKPKDVEDIFKSFNKKKG